MLFSHRLCHISCYLRPAQPPVSRISCLMRVDPTAVQSYVVDTNYLLPWLSYLGFSVKVLSCSIFGFFLLCETTGSYSTVKLKCPRNENNHVRRSLLLKHIEGSIHFSPIDALKSNLKPFQKK